MNREELFDGISDIREELIEEADRCELKKTRPIWKRLTAMAAVIALTIGVGTAGFWIIFGPMKSNAGGGGDSHTTDEAIDYMYYTGPVFPLASLSGSAGITVSRNVNYDFSPYLDQNGPWEAAVTDSYLLTNTTGQDITLELSYPFAGDLGDSAVYLPVITVGGEKTEADLHVGPYSGGFEGVWGSDEEGTYNLDYIESWQEYQALLENGTYRELAYSGDFTLDIPVIVYRVDNYRILDTEKNAANPTLNFEFRLDGDTTIFTWNSNGGRNNSEKGQYQRHISDLDNTYRPPEAMYLLLAGDDLAEYTLQGYVNGGCDKGEEMDITADVTRYETTLEAFLRERMEFTPQPGSEDATISDYLTEDEYFSCIMDMFWSYSELGQAPMERYDFGMLEDYVYGALRLSRVMYLSFTVTIPAGESVEITAAMAKEASYDFDGAGRSKTDCHGYDMMTTLDSDLAFTAQTASLTTTEGIVILSQNFGFDLENGVTAVTLDLNVPHYWLEVAYRLEEPETTSP